MIQIEINFKPIDLHLEEYIEINYRNESEASTYCKEDQCYINGILHHRCLFTGDWIRAMLQRVTCGMKLVRRAKNQDITVP